METVLRYGIILVVLAHGIGHVMGALAAWTSVPMGFTDRPRIFSDGVLMSGPIGRIFGLVWLVALVGFVGAVIGLLTGQSWWPTLAVLASVVSLVVILPWWNTVTPGSRLGATLVDLVILVALVPGWREQVVQFLSEG